MKLRLLHTVVHGVNECGSILLNANSYIASMSDCFEKKCSGHRWYEKLQDAVFRKNCLQVTIGLQTHGQRQTVQVYLRGQRKDPGVIRSAAHESVVMLTQL